MLHLCKGEIYTGCVYSISRSLYLVLIYAYRTNTIMHQLSHVEENAKEIALPSLMGLKL